MAFAGSIKVLTGRVTPAVPLLDAKNYLRVGDGHEEDALIASLVEAATDTVERLTRRSLINQTFRWQFDCFPCGPIELPRSPCSAISAGGSYSYAMPRVRYYDGDGAQQTLVSGTDYLTDLDGTPPSLHLQPFGLWPTTQLGRARAVEVDFVAGYGTSHTDVPALLRQAILIMVATGYENRENASIPDAVSRIARIYSDGSC